MHVWRGIRGSRTTSLLHHKGHALDYKSLDLYHYRNEASLQPGLIFIYCSFSQLFQIYSLVYGSSGDFRVSLLHALEPSCIGSSRLWLQLCLLLLLAGCIQGLGVISSLKRAHTHINNYTHPQLINLILNHQLRNNPNSHELYWVFFL